MEYRTIITRFEAYLRSEEKSQNTIEKYVRDVRHFLSYVRGESWEREQVLQYKEYLREHYKVSSANSMLASLNCFLKYQGRRDCCVQTFRQQRRIFREEEKELSRSEYKRLVQAAEDMGNQRLSYILQTIGSTGIRIGELKYITVEALAKHMVHIHFKGKERVILLPRTLTEMLQAYCRKRNIQKGCIFITAGGQPVDRRNVWGEMKKLCKLSGVQESKVFPHNLRHLFATSYYEKEKDLVRLADFLGHSSVETTRRYTMISSVEACLKQLELGLLFYEQKTEERRENMV